MVKKYEYEVVKNKIKGVPVLKFKVKKEAKKIQRRVERRIVKVPVRVSKAPIRVLSARRLYFKKKDGSYAFI